MQALAPTLPSIRSPAMPSARGQAPGCLLWFALITNHSPSNMAQTAARRAEAPLADDRAESSGERREDRDARLAELLAATGRGDCTAFEAFYDATFACARTVARRMLRGADVDDLLADAYFQAWRTVLRFDVARGSALTWLLTIVRSRCLDLLRQQRSQPSVGGSGPDASAAAAVAGDSGEEPVERLWRRQADARLNAALEQLGAAERWVLGLAYFRDLSHAQIAAATGWPLGTVKTHILRAQQRLRVALAPISMTS